MPIDYKAYPEDWKDVIRPQALRRANYRCQFCGAGQRKKGYREPSGQFIECDDFMLKWAVKAEKKIITIYLSIMHLDHDISNNEPINLKAGCQRCHNIYDAPQRRLNRIMR